MTVWRQKDSKFIFIKTFWGRCYTVYDRFTDLEKIFPYSKIQEGVVAETNQQKFEKYIKANGYMIVYIGWNRKIEQEKFERVVIDRKCPADSIYSIDGESFERVYINAVKKQIKIANQNHTMAKKTKPSMAEYKKRLKETAKNVESSVRASSLLPVDDIDVKVNE